MGFILENKLRPGELDYDDFLSYNNEVDKGKGCEDQGKSVWNTYISQQNQ